MKSAIITGGTGFIGYHLIQELTEQNVEVTAVCSPNSPNLSRISHIQNINIVYCDMADLSKLPDLCPKKEYDVFYHLAWKGASGVLRQDYETQLKNVLWTCNAAKASLELGCKKLVITGTICENQCDDILEKNVFLRSAYYLNAKRTAYNLVSSICKQYGIPLVWCAFYHPVGTYNKKEQLIINTVYKMIYGETLNFGKAQGLFDVIAVEDLCHGLFLAGNTALPLDRYFIGSGMPRKLMDYIEEIKKLVSPDAVVNYGAYPDDNLPMKDSWLDIKPFQNETGFVPKYTFKDIILSVKEWIDGQNELLQ
jgi:nucleoside-diphosphate-sugar epimerase